MIEKLIAPIRSRLRLMVSKALIKSYKDNTVDLDLLAGETRGKVDFMQQYGFSSFPCGECSAVALFVGGNRDNGIVVASRGENIEIGLEKGEVAMHSSFGSSIILKKDGSIVITPKVGQNLKVEGGIEATLDIKAMTSTAAVSLATHTHNSAVGPTTPPMPSA